MSKRKQNDNKSLKYEQRMQTDLRFQTNHFDHKKEILLDKLAIEMAISYCGWLEMLQIPFSKDRKQITKTF